VKASGSGYVVRFSVRRTFLTRYPAQEVGGSQHQEYWIPAEELSEFNDHIVGAIDIIAEFGSEGGA
jgi:hypothetical protein